ncbi:MAG: hypothetical protein FWE90_07310 [Defluviitaleaceae bacterium]|nr:hypothetical protein [Defluviitaleaceae bacterium]
MKVLNKESLYAVTDLTADKIIKMTDTQLRAYQETLTNAVNLFPVQKDRLEDAFAKMDYAPTLQWLKSMRNTLNQIHADNLAKQCDKQLAINQDVENIRHDRLKNFIDFFMASLTMLYKDIQSVLDELKTKEKVKPKESFAKKVKNQLSTVAEINEKTIERMSDDQIKGYINKLKDFLDDCPAQEDGLRSAFKIKNYASVMRWFNVIEGTLTKIHADHLAEECHRQINMNNDYSAIRHEKLEPFVNYVLTSLNMLCADIGSLQLDDR